MQRADTFDLTTLRLRPGDGRRLELEVGVDPLSYAGQLYSVPSGLVEVRVEVSRTTTGYALRLWFVGELRGPCSRCLEEARPRLEVESREIEDLQTDDEELTSPYVTEEELDLRSWARDALALALPEKFLCRPDCKGLCPECGEVLGDCDPEEHRHGVGGDPRLAKLRELLE